MAQSFEPLIEQLGGALAVVGLGVFEGRELGNGGVSDPRSSQVLLRWSFDGQAGVEAAQPVTTAKEAAGRGALHRVAGSWPLTSDGLRLLIPLFDGTVRMYDLAPPAPATAGK